MSVPVELTPALVRRLRFTPGTNVKDVRLFDTVVSGFHLRASPKGKSYWVKYSLRGIQRSKRLADGLPEGLAAARRQAFEIRAAAKLGRDLVGEAKRSAGRARIGELMIEFLKARQTEVRPRTFEELQRYLNVDWLPIHTWFPADVQRADISNLLDKIERGGKTKADRARAALSAFLGWAMERGHCQVNSASGLKARGGNAGRQRTLSPTELREVWLAAGGDTFGTIVRLLILTGSRKSEIMALRWNEVDNELRQIVLPSERVKNHREHVIPLSGLARKILSEYATRPADWQQRPYLFGRYGLTGFSGDSKAKRELDQRIAAARGRPLPHWIVHDLRRTFVSQLSEQRIADRDLVELLVNHVSGSRGGIAGLYDRSQRLEERRRALQRWSKFVERIISEESLS